MGDKLESNKKQKKKLFRIQPLIFHIKRYSENFHFRYREKCRCRQRHFLSVFFDKYDIRNKLISHKASQLFLAAYKQCSISTVLILKTRLSSCLSILLIGSVKTSHCSTLYLSI